MSGLERKLELALKAKEDAVSQLEDANLMVQTLQSQVIDMQKNDAVLRARHQHEEAVRSLRYAHQHPILDLEVLNFKELMQLILQSLLITGSRTYANFSFVSLQNL